MSQALLLSCEHGGNQVPTEYQSLFSSAHARKALQSHRGFDAGALELARRLATRMRAPLVEASVTRLLVDLNRSPGHPRLFSTLTRELPEEQRRRLLAKYYFPHRGRIETHIRDNARQGIRTVHVAVHSFASRLNGEVRPADIGLLYDPGRLPEKRFCARWKESLIEEQPKLRVRRNYPYRGKDDGLPTALRRQFTARLYLGIELEVNQATLNRASSRSAVAETLALSLGGLLD